MSKLEIWAIKKFKVLLFSTSFSGHYRLDLQFVNFHNMPPVVPFNPHGRLSTSCYFETSGNPQEIRMNSSITSNVYLPESYVHSIKISQPKT